MTEARRHPVDAALDFIWGPIPPIDAVVRHVSTTYDVTPAAVAQLDSAWRLDFADPDRRSWVVRVSRRERPIEEVEADVKIMRYLESFEFAAERVAVPEPVSSFDGHAVLVTEFIDGTPSDHSLDTAIALAGYSARLGALPPPADDIAVRHNAGPYAYRPEAEPGTQLDHARFLLEVISDDVPDEHRATHEQLQVAIADAVDLDDLPQALVHPDLRRHNAIRSGLELGVFDWAGVGIGPRIMPLGAILALEIPDGADLETDVAAVVAAYTKHVAITQDEMDRMAAAITRRPLVHETFGFCFGVRLKTTPFWEGQWTAHRDRLQSIASYACAALA